MKRIGYLYDKLLDKEYIKETIILASKHKMKRRTVRQVIENIDIYVDRIYFMIKYDKIILRPTHQRKIFEHGKERTITVSPFYPNQIFDYLLTNTLKPIIRKSLYQYCIGNIDKRGIVYGKRYIERNIKRYNYYIKLDVHHFYQSVNTNKLIQMLGHKIKDEKFLKFARKIINADELPIGCYYSQWLSNFYLTELDHKVREKLKIPLYVRYVDDMLLCANNKKKLLNAMYVIKRELEALSLSLKRTIAKIKIHICNALLKRLIAYMGWLKQIKIGYAYYKNHIRPILKIGYVKYKISLSNKLCII